MNLFPKNKRGETITETIIALSILAIGITFSSTVMSNSLRNMNTSKNRVIAVNLAREGIEAVRNIRDTNWLKFSARRRRCWNHLPQDLVGGEETCLDDDGNDVTDTPIAPNGPTDYIVYLDEDQRWRLAELDSVDEQKKWLYVVDIDKDVNSDGDEIPGDPDAGKINDQDMYNHPLDNALGKDYATQTFFKRAVTIGYLQNDGTAGSPSDNRMTVTSTVTWIRGEAENRVELKTHLSDYLGRENLD